MVHDVSGKSFYVGNTVAVHALDYPQRVILKQVTKIDGDKIYLDNSTKPLNFPDRIAIVS